MRADAAPDCLRVANLGAASDTSSRFPEDGTVTIDPSSKLDKPLRLQLPVAFRLRADLSAEGLFPTPGASTSCRVLTSSGRIRASDRETDSHNGARYAVAFFLPPRRATGVQLRMTNATNETGSHNSFASWCTVSRMPSVCSASPDRSRVGEVSRRRARDADSRPMARVIDSRAPDTE